MVQLFIEGIVDMLNPFPSTNLISDTMAVSIIVERKSKIDLNKRHDSFWFIRHGVYMY